ncbi:hypothetical protein WA158_002248 [Blastocystis sp. Blastoise]
MDSYDFQLLLDSIKSFESSCKDIEACLFAIYASKSDKKLNISEHLANNVSNYLDTEIENMNKKKDLVKRYKDDIELINHSFITDLQDISSHTTNNVSNLISKINLDENVFNDNLESMSVCVDHLRDSKKPAFITQNNEKRYSIPESILNEYYGSYLTELYLDPNVRTPEGDVYIDYKDDYFSLIIDYMNNKSIDFSVYSDKEKKEIADEFSFYRLPFRTELLDLRISWKLYKRKLIPPNPKLLINHKANTCIRNYYDSHYCINSLINQVDEQYIIFDEQQKSCYIDIPINYVSVIEAYLTTSSFIHSTEKIKCFNINLFFNDLKSLCISLSSQLKSQLTISYFSKLLNMSYISKLVQWTGSGQSWQFTFRASEHDFSSKSFHEYCDNKGETLVIFYSKINDVIYSFGGYTKVGWDKSPLFSIEDDKAFLFTLRNPHGEEPTMYPIRSSIALMYNELQGPSFSRSIHISDHCNNNNNSYIDCDANSAFPNYTWNTTYKTTLFVNSGPIWQDNHFIVYDYEVYTRKS